MGPRQEHFQMLALYNAVGERSRLRLCRTAYAGGVGGGPGSLFRVAPRDAQPPPRDGPPVDEPFGGGKPARHKTERDAPRGARDLSVARRVQDQKIIASFDGLSEERLAEPLDYATTSGEPRSQPLHHVLAHLFNHQTHHRGQAHHLIGLARGREKAPVLGLLVYQRTAAGGLLMRRRKKRSCQPRSTVSLPVRRTELHS